MPVSPQFTTFPRSCYVPSLWLSSSGRRGLCGSRRLSGCTADYLRPSPGPHSSCPAAAPAAWCDWPPAGHQTLTVSPTASGHWGHSQSAPQHLVTEATHSQPHSIWALRPLTVSPTASGHWGHSQSAPQHLVTKATHSQPHSIWALRPPTVSPTASGHWGHSQSAQQHLVTEATHSQPHSI